MLFSYRVIFVVSSIVERIDIAKIYVWKNGMNEKKGKVGKALKSRWKAVQTLPHECRIVCMVLTMNKQSGTA